MAQPLGEFAVNLPVNPGIAGRLDSLADVQHAAFGAAYHSFVLFLQAAGEYDVGMLRGFGEKKIHDAKVLEFLESFASVVCIGEQDQGIETD